MAAPTCYIPTQQSDAAAGLTANKVDHQHQHHHAAVTAAAAAAPAPPTSTSSTPHHHNPQQQQQQPSSHESKSFCPSENKEPDGSKAYGTFKSAAPPVPVPVPVNSAFRKDSSSSGAARAGSVQYGEPLHNNTAAGSNWTAMSQTTIILGTDGNTSVQASSAAPGVSGGEPGEG